MIEVKPPYNPPPYKSEIALAMILANYPSNIQNLQANNSSNKNTVVTLIGLITTVQFNTALQLDSQLAIVCTS